MRILAIIFSLILVSCAQTRGPASTSNNKSFASDSIALGNVRVSAIKKAEDQNVCFEIALEMTDVEQKDASASNWTVAWIDRDDRYHLLGLSQRDPAAVPQGGTIIAPYGFYRKWVNNFRTCAPRVKLGDVQALILTPKEIPYKISEGLKLEWN